MTFIVAGVDGGGSKTHVVISDEAGTKVGEAFGAGSAVRPGTARSTSVCSMNATERLRSSVPGGTSGRGTARGTGGFSGAGWKM